MRVKSRWETRTSLKKQVKPQASRWAVKPTAAFTTKSSAVKLQDAPTKKRSRGRPLLAHHPGQHFYSLSFAVREAMHRRCAAYLNATGRSRSDWLRTLIEADLTRNGY